MDKWVGKVAVVTGASAGIGEAILKDLAAAGVNVVGLARRSEKIEELAKELKDLPGKIYAFKCDVTDLDSVKAAFKYVEETLGGLHILVNSAGYYKFTTILSEDESATQDLKKIIDINFTGVLYCIREGYKVINKTGDYGYIININSIAGHACPFPTAEICSYNTYSGTKYAITATTEILRQELVCMNNHKIRVSSLSPGEVKTEMVSAAGYDGDLDHYYKEVPAIEAKDISDGLLYILSTPYNVHVAELTIRPVGEKQ